MYANSLLIAGFLTAGILLLLQHKYAPYIAISISLISIMVRENPLIYFGTDYDKPEIINGIIISMVKLLFLSLITLLKPGPIEESDKPIRDKFDMNKYKMM